MQICLPDTTNSKNQADRCHPNHLPQAADVASAIKRPGELRPGLPRSTSTTSVRYEVSKGRDAVRKGDLNLKTLIKQSGAWDEACLDVSYQTRFISQHRISPYFVLPARSLSESIIGSPQGRQDPFARSWREPCEDNIRKVGDRPSCGTKFCPPVAYVRNARGYSLPTSSTGKTLMESQQVSDMILASLNHGRWECVPLYSPSRSECCPL